MTRARIETIAPLLVVSNVGQTIAFYREKLGFEAEYQHPETDPFFSMLRRDGVMLLIKSHANLTPLPNSQRHPWIAWDAYVYVPDPEALAAEFAGNRVEFRKPLGVNSDNLLGFEIRDPDGYVLFFGRPN